MFATANNKTMASKSGWPPTRRVTSMKAVATSGKVRKSGHTRCPRYVKKPPKIPVKRQTNTVASNTLRFGFLTSSARVVTASKPM